MGEPTDDPWAVQRNALQGFLTQVDAQSPRISERHGQVLDAALGLISERGLSGASLRELARRLNVSQPSLYAYFKSKDELVEQIIARYTNQTFVGLIQELPDRYESIEAFLRGIASTIVHIWNRPQHVLFVRFMFAVALEKAEYGSLMRRYLHDRGRDLAMPLLAPFVARGDVAAEDATFLFDLVSNTIVMHFLMRRVMHAAEEIPGEVERLAEFTVQVAVAGIEHRHTLSGGSNE